METFTPERKIERVTLLRPVPAKAGGERAYVVDASMAGIRISHAGWLPQDEQCGITFEWDRRTIELVGQIRWTRTQRAPSYGNVYLSGFEITDVHFDSLAALRDLIESYVSRALDEPAASQVASEKPNLFARHDWIDGAWSSTMTSDPSQARTGFTVPSEESRQQVVMLRSAYEVADEGLRDLIRRLASMSITDAAAPRRYKP